MPPQGAGLVPQWRESNDQALQFLSLYQPLHIDWVPTKLEENLTKRQREGWVSPKYKEKREMWKRLERSTAEQRRKKEEKFRLNKNITEIKRRPFPQLLFTCVSDSWKVSSMVMFSFLAGMQTSKYKHFTRAAGSPGFIQDSISCKRNKKYLVSV